MRNKRKNKYLLLLILLLGITLGYAAISTTLKITGTANVNKNTWSIYWDENSIAVTNGSVAGTAGVSDDGTVENAQLTWTADLDLPGDFYEFTIDAVNEGSIDAMITNITPTIPADLASYINYSVTYDDGMEPALNHLLPKATKSGNTVTPTRKKYKVRVEFDSDATPDDLDDIGENGDSYTFEYAVTYAQATDAAIDIKGLIASCPGCEFGMVYNGDYLEINSETMYDIGDTLPLEIATSNTNVLASNYEGATTDYTKLKLGVRRIKCQNDDSDYYEVQPWPTCIYYNQTFVETLPNVEKQRNKFHGFVLDSDRIIQKKYLCGINENKPFCLEITRDSTKYDEVFVANKKVLRGIYGDYDSNTGKGCKDELINGDDIYICFGELNAFIRNHSSSMIIGENDIDNPNCELDFPGYFIKTYNSDVRMPICVDPDTGKGTCGSYACSGI